LAGPKFALIDPEFAFSEETSSSVGSKKRLLVSYGGSDPTDETTKILKAVRLLRHNKQCREWLGGIDVVVGQTNTRKDDVIRFAQGIEDVIVHIAPRSLAPLMRNADLFLTAGGNSMIEGLTMRKPCLVTLTSDNQALMMGQLLEQRAILSLGHYIRVGPLDVAKAVTKILSEYEQFANNIKGRPIFDHLGARRISAAIQ
jgi:UDP-2,4-diacetamido-2,4,6-trideoxy-beta-L-altropyranose hydrolase